MSTIEFPGLPSPPLPAPRPQWEGPVVPFTKSMFRLQNALGGRYALVAELGKGGMGVVYLAREIALDRLVALKILPPAMAADGRASGSCGKPRSRRDSSTSTSCRSTRWTRPARSSTTPCNTSKARR